MHVEYVETLWAAEEYIAQEWIASFAGRVDRISPSTLPGATNRWYIRLEAYLD